ncbi:MAG: GGDEF domain-containing protein [Bacillota bacterium]|nr:GGDEF domain-containing protein [Bacillota bacterium]
MDERRTPEEYEATISQLKEEILKLKEEVNKYKFLAEHDMLTGLYVHTSARYLIEEKIKDQPGRKFGFAVIDLDEFKKINDTYGHLFGDSVLMHVAGEIFKVTEEGDVAARIGGDEFLIFFSGADLQEKEKSVIGIMDQLSRPYGQTQIKASMGISRYPEDGENYRQLFLGADKALYRAKRSEKEKYCFYDGSMK